MNIRTKKKITYVCVGIYYKFFFLDIFIIPRHALSSRFFYARGFALYLFLFCFVLCTALDFRYNLHRREQCHCVFNTFFHKYINYYTLCDVLMYISQTVTLSLVTNNFFSMSSICKMLKSSKNTLLEQTSYLKWCVIDVCSH